MKTLMLLIDDVQFVIKLSNYLHEEEEFDVENLITGRSQLREEGNGLVSLD